MNEHGLLTDPVSESGVFNNQGSLSAVPHVNGEIGEMVSAAGGSVLRSAHRGKQQSPPQFNITVFHHLQSDRVDDGTDDCEVGQRTPRPVLLLICARSRHSWILKGDNI